MYPAEGRRELIDERRYIKDALYDVIAAIVSDTGRSDPVIYDNEKGVRPKPPFISIAFLGGETPGMPNFTKADANGVQKVIQFVRKTLTMYAFGEGTIDLLETVKGSFYFQRWRDALASAHLVIPQTHNVLEHSGNIDGEWENSASFDFDITYIRVFEDNTGFIEQAELRDNFIREGNNTI